MKILDTTNIDLINFYLFLKRNNIPTENYLEKCKSLYIEKVYYLCGNKSKYCCLKNLITIVEDYYDYSIMHELMHVAQDMPKVYFSFFDSEYKILKHNALELEIFWTNFGAGLNEGNTEYFRIKSAHGTLKEFDYSSDYIVITELMALLINIVGYEKHKDLLFENNILKMYIEIIKSIGLNNTLLLMHTTDLYRKFRTIDKSLTSIFDKLIEILDERKYSEDELRNLVNDLNMIFTIKNSNLELVKNKSKC